MCSGQPGPRQGGALAGSRKLRVKEGELAHPTATRRDRPRGLPPHQRTSHDRIRTATGLCLFRSMVRRVASFQIRSTRSGLPRRERTAVTGGTAEWGSPPRPSSPLALPLPTSFPLPSTPLWTALNLVSSSTTASSCPCPNACARPLSTHHSAGPCALDRLLPLVPAAPCPPDVCRRPYLQMRSLPTRGNATARSRRRTRTGRGSQDRRAHVRRQ